MRSEARIKNVRAAVTFSLRLVQVLREKMVILPLAVPRLVYEDVPANFAHMNRQSAL